MTATSGNIQAQPLFTEPVPQLPQGSGTGGPDPARRDPGAPGDFGVRAGVIGEQHPDQGPPERR